MYISKKYQEAHYPMPDRDSGRIPKEVKRGKEYCMKMCEHAYSTFIKGSAYATQAEFNSVAEYRLYANGMQSQEKYKDGFLGKNNNNIIPVGVTASESRKAYASIDFSVISPMPLIIESVINKIKRSTDNVSVDAIDPESGAEKENLKWGTYVDGKFQDMFSSLRAIAGLPQEELSFVPKNVEELNLYDAEGGFKQDYVIAMEELVKYVLDQSLWDEQLLVDVLYDLVVNGFAVIEDTFTEATGEVKVEYRDPLYSAVQYTRESQYAKPDWGFTMVMEKVSNIRRIFPELDEQDIHGLARNYDGKFGNGNIENWNDTQRKTSSYGCSYDYFVVPVVKAKWIDVEYDNEVSHINRVGHVRTYPLENGMKLGKKDKAISTRKKMIYECSWIVESDHCYDFGPARYQPRDGMSDPSLPFHAVKVKGRPIVPRVIPALDMFQTGWLKLQHGLAMAALNGFSINLDAINNMTLGATKLSPLDAIKIWRQTGILFRKDTNVINAQGTSSRAIEPLMGGAGAVIQEAREAMETASKMIEDTTGINALSLGASPNQTQGKAVTEFAIEGTNNALSGIILKANVLKAEGARNVCLRLQIACSSNKKSFNLYKNVIGETRMELLKIAEGHDARYAIRTQVRPTDQEKQELFEVINMSIKNGRDGKVGITEADVVRFKSMINSGASLKRVAQLLAFANKKAQDEAQVAAERSQQLNAQLAQQTEQMKSQLDIQTTGMKTQMAVEQAKQKSIGDILLEAVKLNTKSADEALRLLGFVPPPPPQVQDTSGQGMANQMESQGSALQEAPAVAMGGQSEPSSFPVEGV